MPDRKVKVMSPITGRMADGTEVNVDESSERWSEFTLTDGTVVRAKHSVASAVRVDGEYDAEGNPVYMVKGAPIVMIVHADDALRQRKQ